MPNVNDYYSDAAPSPEAAPATAPESAEPEEASENQTAVLPKAVLGGTDFKPGEKMILEVVEVMEDSVLVRYPTEEEVDEETEEPMAEPEATEPAAAPAMGGGNPMYA